MLYTTTKTLIKKITNLKCEESPLPAEISSFVNSFLLFPSQEEEEDSSAKYFLSSTTGEDLLLFISLLRFSFRCLTIVFSEGEDSSAKANAGSEVAGLGR